MASGLFHLAVATEWARRRRAGVYTGSTLGRSLAEVGFVHCSFARHVGAVADAVYRGRRDVVLLRIDPDRLDAEVRVEAAGTVPEAYPHVYGPVPLAAVVRADPVPPGPAGKLRLAGLLGPDGWRRPPALGRRVVRW